MIDEPFIICPRCARKSHHPKDIEQRYCGFCHMFHEQMDVVAGPEARMPRRAQFCQPPERVREIHDLFSAIINGDVHGPTMYPEDVGKRIMRDMRIMRDICAWLLGYNEGVVVEDALKEMAALVRKSGFVPNMGGILSAVDQGRFDAGEPIPTGAAAVVDSAIGMLLSDDGTSRAAGLAQYVPGLKAVRNALMVVYGMEVETAVPLGAAPIGRGAAGPDTVE
jgi:hypothetical protein